MIVNCVLWDVMRKDNTLHQNVLPRMKRDSTLSEGYMISEQIDVACDNGRQNKGQVQISYESSKDTIADNRDPTRTYNYGKREEMPH